nr:N-6 DNA methylase [Euzebyaceae bacterium]
PTIVEPWTASIQAAATVDQAVQVLTDLCRLRVLDPACGSGNFLFIAYRELRELERQATRRVAEIAAAHGVAVPAGLPQYPLTNLHGIEIDPFAARVTRLVLWMGHKLAADRHGSPEPPLPLPDLDEAISQDDALKIPWPEVDVIIGNPPFNGSQLLRRDLGDDYLRFLEREFRCGIRDFCTYWFRRAADHLPPGGRAGLVGTNSVGQGRGREASLDYVLQQGGVIVDAHATQKWPGEAKVHVAIVNWVKAPSEPVTRFRLAGQDVSGGIAADLVPAALSTLEAPTAGREQERRLSRSHPGRGRIHPRRGGGSSPVAPRGGRLRGRRAALPDRRRHRRGSTAAPAALDHRLWRPQP